MGVLQRGALLGAVGPLVGCGVFVLFSKSYKYLLSHREREKQSTAVEKMLQSHVNLPHSAFICMVNEFK